MLVSGVGRPRVLVVFVCFVSLRSIYRVDARLSSASRRRVSLRDERDKTLSGGSLGSCVDEERSQLREVM